jgi:hypothetical protein
MNLNVFRKGIKPCWEDAPQGGSFNLKYREKAYRVQLWEYLIYAAIGGFC